MIVELNQMQARTTFERLGGRWAISWQGCAINAVLASSIFLAEGLSTPGSPGVIPWLLLVALSLTVPLAVMIAFDQTLFRNRRTVPVNPVIVVLVNGLLGGLFNVCIWIGASQWNIPTSSASISSVAIVVILSMWWGSALSIFLDYREESRTERGYLIESAVQVELASLQQEEILLGIQAELDQEVAAELQPLREELARHVAAMQLEPRILETRQLPDTASVTMYELAESIRTTSEQSLRPLSRRMWNRGSKQYERTPWWNLPLNVIRYQPFRPWTLMGVHAVLTVAGLVRLFGTTRGLVLLAVELLAIYVITTLFNNLFRRFPAHHVSLFILGTLVLQISIPLRAAVREEWAPGSGSIGWQITQLFTGVFVIMVTSGIGAWISETDHIRANFRAVLDAESITSIARTRQVADIARASSRVLHGSVQTRLVACAMAIDRAVNSSNSPDLNIALREAASILESPMATQPESTSLTEEVNRKVSMWQGVCSIDVSLDAHLDTYSGPISPVALIVEEGVANSVRRGDATWVGVSLTLNTNGSIYIQIDDDGTGPGGGALGIGSAVIDQATQGQWALSPTDRGARLTATIPR